MRRRLPPLNTLRVFESGARRLSFTRAAEELHVTQAAVSHQIKALEDWLGTPLFLRLNRGLKLTPAAERYLRDVTAALDLISSATGQLMRPDDRRILSVAAFDSFASTWLLPRLKTFRRQYPDIDLRVWSVDREVDVFERGDIDLEIRYGDGNWPELSATKLLDEEVFPVCSPALAAGPPPLLSPGDLKRHTLLHDIMVADWNAWLDAAEVTDVDGERGPGFNHSYLVIQAAIDGQGVALGRSVLVADALARGELVRPFSISIPCAYSYYLVCTEPLTEDPVVAAFCAWITTQAEVQPALAPVAR
jgi:LysR family transcriptional regulator, glycine cleavage system transcriptional activator